VVRELGIAYAALGIEGMGGARVTVRPVPAPTDPLTSGGLDPVRGAPTVRRRLLAAPAGRDSAGGVLVQVGSPRPERTGWAYVVGCWVDGPAMVGEAGPFVGPTRCPPPGAMLREIGRLARLARAVLQQPCQVRWVCVGPRVELIEVRRSAATR
jgi:hypothetical protein